MMEDNITENRNKANPPLAKSIYQLSQPQPVSVSQPHPIAVSQPQPALVSQPVSISQPPIQVKKPEIFAKQPKKEEEEFDL
jgi:hypothetical protein